MLLPETNAQYQAGAEYWLKPRKNWITAEQLTISNNASLAMVNCGGLMCGYDRRPS